MSVVIKNNCLRFSNLSNKSGIEFDEKLRNISSYNEIYFRKCSDIKIYKKVFSFLIKQQNFTNISKQDKPWTLQSLNILKINRSSLSKIIHNLCECLSIISLKKFMITDCHPLNRHFLTHEQLSNTHICILQCLSKAVEYEIDSNQPSSALESLTMHNFHSNPLITDSYIPRNSILHFENCLFSFLIECRSLRILDIRCLRLNAKQNLRFAQALLQLQKQNLLHLHTLKFGGYDKWSSDAINCMCDYINLAIKGKQIKHGRNIEPCLEVLCIDSIENTFFSMEDQTAIQVFLKQTLEERPKLTKFIPVMMISTLMTLELFHIKPKILQSMGEIFDRGRIHNCILSELSINTIPESSAFGPSDHLVVPSIVKMVTKMKYLQMLQIRAAIYGSLMDCSKFATILRSDTNVRLNFIKFFFKIGQNQSSKQLVVCMNHMLHVMKKNGCRLLMIGEEKESLLSVFLEFDSEITNDIFHLILSFVDVSFACNAGILIFECSIMDKLSKFERKEMNDYLISNWKKLPFNGDYIHDQRYQIGRQKLKRLCKDVQNEESKVDII